MEFTTPTTLTEMYTILKNMYNHYRIKRGTLTLQTRSALSLERLSYTPLLDSQITAKANLIVEEEKQKFFAEKREQLNREINECTEKISALDDSEDERVEKVNEEYTELLAKIQGESEKRGVEYSTVINNRIAQASAKKTEKIDDIEEDIADKKAIITAKKTALQTQLSGLETTYQSRFTAMLNRVKQDIRDEEAKKAQEIEKYNNSQEEKELKDAITKVQNDNSLKVKYLEISTTPLSKEELVEIGYYEDVLAVVDSYFGTLSAQTAYTQFAQQTRLIYYLDDFYQDTLYMYKTLANVT